MAMRTSDAGIAEIASHEAIVQYPYLDSVGIWTMGIGHTASAGRPSPDGLPKGVEIPMEVVLDTFRRDLKTFEARVNRFVKVPLKQHEFDALVSFDFNTGGIHKARLTGLLNAGDRAGAANAFLGWSKPASIIPRRKKEQALFRDGFYSSAGRATSYRATESGQVVWSSGKSVDINRLLGGGGSIPTPRDKPKRKGDLFGIIATIFSAIFKAVFKRK